VLSQLEKGLEPLVVTSPSQAPQGELDGERSEVIDGVRYFRSGSELLPPSLEVRDRSPFRSALRVLQNISLFQTALRVAKRYRPAVIHAHSPFTCGLVGNLLGRWLGIPKIYEMRGIWEDSHVGRGSFEATSFRYRGVRILENQAIQSADRCCVISEALAREVRSRGVSQEKIILVPNGVDVKTFVPGPPSRPLQERYALQDAVTLGYIGSFFHYEGLDLLVEAMTPLAEEFPRVRLLLVGDGELTPRLTEMAAQPSLSGRVIFVGRVPHQEIAEYYRLCDLFVLPRRDTRETRLVTPLKPMEIMAMGKALVASDIGGHREMIQDRFNGLFFRAGDVADLVAGCRELISNEDLRVQMGIRARRWVEENRDWSVLVERYVDLYSRLTGQTQV
jgi:PEP-CTERM/exosortase A-associated glycosyltransferase